LEQTVLVVQVVYMRFKCLPSKINILYHALLATCDKAKFQKYIYTHFFSPGKVARREAREAKSCRRGGGQAARERYDRPNWTD
jgi:hypothetical protein